MLPSLTRTLGRVLRFDETDATIAKRATSFRDSFLPLIRMQRVASWRHSTPDRKPFSVYTSTESTESRPYTLA